MKNIKRNIQRLLAVVLAFILVVVSQLGSISLKIKAAETFDENYRYFFCLGSTDFLLHNGSVGDYDTYYYKNPNVTSQNRVNYNSDIHTSEWIEQLRPAYCLQVNAAYPQNCEYETVKTLEEGKLYWRVEDGGAYEAREFTEAQQNGLANLLENSSFTEYWASRNVANYGAQVLATQIAIWIVLGQYSNNPNEWSGNVDKYGEAAVGGMEAMIDELVECYNNPTIKKAKPKLTVTTGTATANYTGSRQDVNFFVTSKDCKEDITLTFSYTKDGIEYTGLPSDTAAYLIDGEGYSHIFDSTTNSIIKYHLYNGSIKVIINCPYNLDYRDILFKVTADVPKKDFSVDKIYYYETTNTVSKTDDDSNIYVRQNMMGYTKSELPGASYFKEVGSISPQGKLNIVKQDDRGLAISGVEFGIYSDAALTNRISSFTTDSEGKGAFYGEFGQTYYLVEENQNSNKYEETIIIEGSTLTPNVGEGIPFTFNVDQTITIAGTTQTLELASENPNVYAVSQNIKNITKKFADISVYKIDSKTQLPLAGVQFKLYTDLQCTTEVANSLVTTNEQGIATFPTVPLGTYYMKEVPVNNGEYIIDDSVVTIALTTENTTYNATTDRYVKTVKKENTPKPLKISVAKQGEVLTGYTNGKFTYETRYIGGVKFGLYDNAECSGTPIATVTTAAGIERNYFVCDDYFIEKNKTYYIKEMATTDTYLISNEIKSITTTAKGSTESYVAYDDTEAYVNVRRKFDLTLTKRGFNNALLSGVEFTLYANEDIKDIDGNIIFNKDDEIKKATTDANGKIAFGSTSLDLPLGSYYICETKELASYQKNTTKYTVDLRAETNVNPSVELVSVSKNITNTPKPLKISVSKKGEVLTGFNNGSFIYETRYLGGAVFGLYDNANCSGTPIATLTTEAGVERNYFRTADDDIKWNTTYYVKEISAPAGYIVSGEIKSITPIEKTSTTDNILYDDIEAFTNVRQTIELDIVKKGFNSKLLSGVEFTLYADEDIKNVDGTVIVRQGEVIKKATTDANGKVAFTNLPRAKVKYVETKALGSYKADTTEHKVNLSEVADEDRTIASVLKTENISNTAKEVRVSVSKQGEVLKGYANGKFTYELAYLGGIKFGIYDNAECSGTPIVTLITEAGVERNYFETGNTLVWDKTYYIAEIETIEGYVKTSTIKSITPREKNSDDANTIKYDDVDKFTNNRQKFDVTLTKTGHNDTRLRGAEFTLYANDDIYAYGKSAQAGDTPLVKKDEIIKVGTTDANGILSFKACDLPREEFYIIETAAPTGYQLPKTEAGKDVVYKFNLETESNKAENKDVENVSVKFLISNTAYPTKIGISKLGETLVGYDKETHTFTYQKNYIGGVKFGVYSDSKCKNLVTTITTVEGQEYNYSEPLEFGDYYIAEISTLTGYVLDKTISPITLTAKAPEFEIIYERLPEFTNERQTLSLKMFKNNENNGIEGAKFQLVATEDIYAFGTSKANGDTPLIKKDEIIGTGITDKNGNLVFNKENGYDLPVSVYALIEIEAPKGYVLDTTPTIFDMYEACKLESNLYAGIVENSLSFVNEIEYELELIPEGDGAGGEIAGNPNTGDNTNIFVWIGLGIIAILTAALAIFFSKKKNENK